MFKSLTENEGPPKRRPTKKEGDAPGTPTTEKSSKYQLSIEKMSIDLLMNQPTHHDEKVPIIVRHCCQAMVHDPELLTQDGIFRESPDMQAMQNYLLRYNAATKETYQKDYEAIYKDMCDTKGIFISALLRFYTNNLPDPLFGEDNYAKVLQVCKTRDHSELLVKLKELISTLSLHVRYTIIVLFYLLTKVDAVHDKMKADNLAKVMAPSMARKKDPTMNDFQDISFIISGTKCLITNFYDVFEKSDLSILDEIYKQ